MSAFMKKYIPLFLLLFLLFVTAVHAQAQQRTVLGTVRDLVLKTAVESVQVVLVNKHNSALRFGALSDKTGSWSVAFVTDVEHDAASVPAGFALEQNYPNPFNPSTKIRFYLPRAGTAVITVHTVLGQELDRMDVTASAGLTEVEWQSMGAAGVLFYTIEFEKMRITRKMMQLDGGGHRGLGSVHTIASAPMRAMASVAESPEYYVISSRLGYETDTISVTLTEQTVADVMLETLHNRAFVIDLHNDVMEWVLKGYQLAGPRPDVDHHTDLPSMKQGGLDAQMFSIYISPTDTLNWYARTVACIDLFDQQMARNPLHIEQARTTAEIRSLHARGKIAAVLGLEGGHSIENDLSKLIALYKRGIRYLTLTWNNSTPWATSARDKLSETKGLSEFGRQVIRTMDSLGVIVDVSHVGVQSVRDVLAITKHPIIASHSGARALYNNTRNLTDDQIRAIAATGGVIGVVFYPSFLSATPKTVTLETVVKHIDYIKNLVGADYVALGSDFDGIEIWPVGLENVTKFPDLTMALLKRGYTTTDVRKILGGNYMRVFETVCK